MKKKTLLFVVIFALFTLAIVYFIDHKKSEFTGDGGASTLQATKTVKKDTLSIAVSTGPTSLDPVETSLMYNDAVLRLLYDNLIRLDANMNFIPHLVESYDPVSDTEWRFLLRDGIRFSDGTPMTTEDVKASIEACNKSRALGSFAAWLKEVRIEDERTFVIVTREPTERLLLDLAQYSYVVPKKLLTEPNYRFNEKPIGSGPYKLVEWEPGNRLVFVANEDYFLPDDKARIPNLIWRIIPDGTERTLALRNGEVDFLYDVWANDLKELEEDPRIEVFSIPYSSPFYLCFNLKKPGMDNLNVRKAIAAAINRDNAVQLATGGYATPLISCAASGLLGSTDDGAQPYDLEKAREFMEKSGLPEDKRTFTVLTKEEPFKTALESIRSDLEEIGVTLNVQMLDTATYTARGADGDFDMITGKSGVADILIYANSAFKTGAFVNFNFLSDEYVDDLIDEGSRTLDATKREEIVTKLVTYCNENCFRTGIYQLSTTRAFDARLKGFETNLISFDRYNKLHWSE